MGRLASRDLQADGAEWACYVNCRSVGGYDESSAGRERLAGQGSWQRVFGNWKLAGGP